MAGAIIIAVMAVTQSTFGAMPDGTKIDLFTLTNAHGVEVRVITYGAAIVSGISTTSSPASTRSTAT
jgi:hypothetical protein